MTKKPHHNTGNTHNKKWANPVRKMIQAEPEDWEAFKAAAEAEGKTMPVWIVEQCRRGVSDQ